jgi:4-hydroxy-3-methylbut-2-en-1-yl diphosphate reductase
MEILLAQHSGFCFGVKRAIQIALEASDGQQDIFTLGPLIHSPQMVQELSQHGIRMAEDPAELHNSTVIVRSHGISLSDKETLLENGNVLIDATCPYVSKAQEHVRQLCSEGYPVVIIGDRDHPEVIAMLSYCGGETLVIGSPDEVPDKFWQKLGVLSQTTKNMALLQETVSRLLPHVKELRLFNTICTATSIRQEATTALAKISDLMIIIGGRNSSNTRMLAALCSGITRTLHVETADEISEEQISSQHRIGLTAGASTPDYLIVDVYNRINKLTGNRTTVKSVEDIPVNKEESC